MESVVIDREVAVWHLGDGEELLLGDVLPGMRASDQVCSRDLLVASLLLKVLNKNQYSAL